jgi:hypothetical protein
MTPEQEQLVLDHMKIVPAIARQLVKRLGLPYWIDIDAAVSKHSEGKTLREIGAEQGRSASWAHYRVHCGERQLKEALLDPAGNDA